jgi:hypothetical protein
VSWYTKSIRKYLTAEQCESYEDCLARVRRSNPQPYSTTADHAEQLEEDLARAVLLIHTLTEACIRKGVFTREEVAQVSREIDLFDGVADGRLDPTVVRPAPPTPPKPLEARWR